MPSYVNEELRRLVARRAEHLCEYCLIYEEDTFYGCEVDHIISLKHGGPTEADNLAYSCAFCNRQKGSDIGSIERRTGEFSRFFNPRIDRWGEHFRLQGAIIQPQSAIGEATSRILGFNHSDRLLERQTLIAVGRYPAASALARMVRG
jgi:HNH endonuclease